MITEICVERCLKSGGELKAIHHKEALDKCGCVHETNSFFISMSAI